MLNVRASGAGDSADSGVGGGPLAPTRTSFLPEDYLQRKAESRANAVSLVLFGVVLFGVVGAFFVTNRAWTAVRRQQLEINQQYTEQTRKIEQLKALEVQKAEMLDKAEITAALIEKVPRSILLAELINRMPERVTLGELHLTGKRIAEPVAAPANGPQSLMAKGAVKAGAPGVKVDEPKRLRPPRIEYTLTIAGYSPSDESVADYQKSLGECPLLAKVDLVSSQETTVDHASMRKFRLEAQIRPDADARRIDPLKVPRLGARAGEGQAAAAEPGNP